MTNDLDIFFADSDETATFGAGTPVPILFGSPSKVVGMFDGAVNSTAPGFLMKTADASANNVDNGSAVTITGTTGFDGSYTVSEVDSDGFGMSFVTLTKG